VDLCTEACQYTEKQPKMRSRYVALSENWAIRWKKCPRRYNIRGSFI